jgi:hypothetical protein
MTSPGRFNDATFRVSVHVVLFYRAVEAERTAVYCSSSNEALWPKCVGSIMLRRANRPTVTIERSRLSAGTTAAQIRGCAAR